MVGDRPAMTTMAAFELSRQIVGLGTIKVKAGLEPGNSVLDLGHCRRRDADSQWRTRISRDERSSVSGSGAQPIGKCQWIEWWIGKRKLRLQRYRQKGKVGAG